MALEIPFGMDGSEGGGGLSTRDHHCQKRVSLSQKGKDVDEGHLPSGDMGIIRSGLTKEGSLCASSEVADAEPAVIDDVACQTSRPCRASKSDYADPAGTISTDAVAASGITGAVAESGEIVDSSVAWGFSDPTNPKGKGVQSQQGACPSTDLVSSVSHERGDPKKGSSWALVVGVSSDEENIMGKAADDAVAERVCLASAGIKGNAGGQSKVILSIGKDGSVDVAGSRIHKKRPIREWVKTKSYTPGNGSRPNGIIPPTVSKVSTGVVVPATTVKQTGVEVGPIADVLQSAPVLEGSALSRPAPSLFDKNTHSEFSILGLGDDDFPPIRPLSASGASIEASKLESGSEKGRGASVSHNWRSLFVNRLKSCSTLPFYKPSKLDGKMTVNPPPEAVAEGVGLWEGSLVGQFFVKRLPVHVVKSFVERLWGKHEIPAISTTDNGWYIFRFRDMAARDWVLDNGPWYFSGRPIILRFWKPGMEMLNAQITSLPIWVKFFNIPLEYWTVTSLGYIASVVGIPMHLDTLTENHSRLSFARICIEVDVNCTFPKSALLDLGNGKYSTIRIEYPWVPQNCAHCKIFGHSQVKCKGVKEKVNSGETHMNHMNHFDKGPAKGYIVDADSSPVSKAVNTADEIDIHITTPGKAGNVQVSDIQERLTGNTFECLSICDDAGNPKVAVDTIAAGTDSTIPNVISTLSGVGSLESPKLDLINIAEFSDTSPVCETFKQVKRIDELDYLPLSKKKLKKLRKQEHATKSANSSSRVDTISPYIVGID